MTMLGTVKTGRQADEVAKAALDECVASIFGDGDLSDSERFAKVAETAGQYAAHVGRSLDAVAPDLGDALTKARHPNRVQARAAAQRAAEAQRRLQDQHDPRTPEDEEPKMSKIAKVRELAAEIRKARPDLSEASALERAYAENPGLRQEVYADAGREFGSRGSRSEIAKQTSMSSAQITAVAKAAELRQENPQLSEHQALAKVYETDPALFRKLLDEQRGDLPPAA